MSRYYDPEIGQFISMDTPDYLAPETIFAGLAATEAVLIEI